MNLYEITSAFKVVQSLDLSEEEIVDTLESLEFDFHNKVESILFVIKNLESTCGQIDEEVDRLKERGAAHKKRISWLKQYLRESMETVGEKKISFPLFTVSVAAGRDVTIVDDESAIPDDLVDIETKIKPMKNEIKKRILAGEEVPGAHLEKSASSLRIK